MASEETIAKVAALFRINWPEYAEKNLRREGEMSQLMSLWLRTLGDIPDEALIGAAEKCLTDRTWWPKIAEIREAAFSIMTNRAGLPSAFEAWAEVNKAVHESKPEKHAWSHPLIKAALEGIGGLHGYRMSETSEEMTWRAHFYRSYESLTQREQESARMLPQVRALAERLAGGQVKELEEG